MEFGASADIPGKRPMQGSVDAISTISASIAPLRSVLGSTRASPTSSAVDPSPHSLSEVVSALSFALDLTEDARPGHAVRTCLLGMRIAAQLDLPDDQLSSLYYALLLKDLGCSCNANLLCEMVGGDDRAIKRRVKLEDWRYPSISGVRLLWEHAGAGQPVLAKSTRVVRLALRRRGFRNELVRLRCQCAVAAARKIGLSADTVEAIANIDEHWSGHGYPNRLRGEAVPLLARIVNLAQCLDLFASDNGTAAALRLVRHRSGSWFDPHLVRIARSLASQGGLWLDYGSGMERKIVLDLEPGAPLRADEKRIDNISEALADVVDAKSPFTYGHSHGVRNAAMHIACQMGLGDDRARLIQRAALLHDIGKLRVPNTILDKPGKLDVVEWQVVREHPGLGGEILGRIKPFKELARIVAEHHEKLDGSGYPTGLRAGQLSIESRIVAAADVYAALLEDRAYRKALNREEAFARMQGYLPQKLDPECCAALFDSLATGPPCEYRDR
jgi:putative nucleotidyltransferase with HDIG domain